MSGLQKRGDVALAMQRHVRSQHWLAPRPASFRSSLLRCTRCRDRIPEESGYYICGACACCAYCSHDCKLDDRADHSEQCSKLETTMNAYEKKAGELSTTIRTSPVTWGTHICVVFGGDDVSTNLVRGDGSELVPKEVIDAKDAYLDARMEFIEEVIHEGSRRGKGCDDQRVVKGNEFAFEVAIEGCRDLILLRRDSALLPHIYLLTGRYQESYNLSCLNVRKGRGGLDNRDRQAIWLDKLHQEDVTKSYFQRKSGDDSFFVNNVTPNGPALFHMFLVKYLLHVDMANLIAINEHFVDSRDCMELIGDFLGVKREWMKWEKNWYWDQAVEVLRLINCERLFGVDDLESHYLSSTEGVEDFAEEFFPQKMNIIRCAIEAGWKGIASIQHQQTPGKFMPAARWEEIIESYEADRQLLYNTGIRPALPWVLRFINNMAGWSAFGRMADPSSCVSEFVAEAIRGCSNCDVNGFFWTLYEFEDCLESEDDYEDEWKNEGHISRVVGACISLENRLAQCHFHKNNHCDQASAILDRLPGGRNLYISYLPTGYLGDGDKYSYRGAPGVEKVVDALLDADLATQENLAVLFGNSGFVSLSILACQKKREDLRQKSISNYVLKTRLWKEGCIDNDTSLGLKLQWLTKGDRRDRFNSVVRQMPLGNTIGNLAPSLEPFVKKFGWNELGLDEDGYFGKHVSATMSGNAETECAESVTKRQKCELDSFSTAEEACRHFFKTSTIEEAIWDFVGIPRVVVADGNEEELRKAGWKHCRYKFGLGDDAVQLGSRVAHLYSGPWCTVWMEQSD